uniref:Secreted protein n=1 Tax=Aegilops tauschii subsp. strangulata TaxID=200361 RepID=A0A453MVJ9_AEGTS
MLLVRSLVSACCWPAPWALLLIDTYPFARAGPQLVGGRKLEAAPGHGPPSQRRRLLRPLELTPSTTAPRSPPSPPTRPYSKPQAERWGRSSRQAEITSTASVTGQRPTGLGLRPRRLIARRVTSAANGAGSRAG